MTPALDTHQWSMRDLIRHQRIAHNSWKSRRFISRPLSPEWSSKFHPVMAISSSRLVVAAGNSLFCYKFTPPKLPHSEAPRVVFERVVTFPNDARRDISGVAFEPDGEGLVLSFVHGALGRISLPQSTTFSPRQRRSVRAPDLSYFRVQGHPIRSMSVIGKTIVTVDSVGLGSMYSLSDSNPPLTSSITVGGGSFPVTGWSTYLSMNSSAGFAVFGTSSKTPLVAHGITESGISPNPQAILALPGCTPETLHRAVYSITGATPTFPCAHSSDQIVISGWYHGVICVHDLRLPSHSRSSHNGPVLSPVQMLHDPISLSSIYSLSSAGAHIAAGSARNNIVHLYDIRSPRAGWCIYLPQGQGQAQWRSRSSPVYSCLLEGTRLWAATESRPFVVDFGEVHEGTFPPVSDRNVGMRRNTSGNVGWYTPVYEHSLWSNSM